MAVKKAPVLTESDIVRTIAASALNQLKDQLGRHKWQQEIEKKADNTYAVTFRNHTKIVRAVVVLTGTSNEYRAARAYLTETQIPEATHWYTAALVPPAQQLSQIDVDPVREQQTIKRVRDLFN